jgi:putative Ig domain-containing protein
VKRFLLTVVPLLAGLAFAPSAFAGGYTDASYLTPVGKVGQPYYHVIAWRPGQGCPPYSYHLDPGNHLPPGLSLDVGSGKITGTPTKEGSWTFYVSQIDQCGVEGQGNSPFTIKIEGSAPPLTVTTSTLRIATTGIAYTATLSASGGGSLTWSLAAGSLPAGLQLAANGTISGTPTAVGSSTFTVKVTDGSRSSTRELSLRVIAPFAAATPAMQPGEVGRPLTVSLSATGGITPYAWSLGSGTLPAGLLLDASTGTISGVPEVAGSFPVRVTASDSNGSSTTLELTLTVRAKLAVTSTRLRSASAGRSYRVRLRVRGGVGPLTWKLGGGRLPRGLRLDEATGTLSGRPRTAGAYRITVVVTDALGARTTRAFRLIVRR